jgi:hypothetical protein
MSFVHADGGKFRFTAAVCELLNSVLPIRPHQSLENSSVLEYFIRIGPRH